jgi:hypothetical protein
VKNVITTKPKPPSGGLAVIAATDEARQCKSNKGQKNDRSNNRQPKQTTQEIVEQFVKENNMEAIVEKMVKQTKVLKSYNVPKDSILEKLYAERNTSREMRDTVRNKFREMLDGDKDATIEMDLDDINELLSDIGASAIRFTYSVDVTVTATITGIEADNEEQAREKAIAANRT